MVFLQKIKEIRLHSFLSQNEFTKKPGALYAVVDRWETGKNSAKY